MAIGVRLKSYLALERAMIDLDEAGDEMADAIRDRMDPIWLGLTPQEWEALDNRLEEPAVFAGTISPDTSRRDFAVRKSVRDHFQKAA